ncbi:hypothetical protein OD917_01100 [Flavobacterium sp. SH_e]|uniref:hypothetical protein n=1 Tax=Flavobacterium sp. SH_e TaxID=2983767 RepID=UPI0021E437A0|nr:hypothetical protein [Flavobacterium sp. SH_e]MCV2483502.1 hypothetical protein [Flavobacterium sp. SH_e]
MRNLKYSLEYFCSPIWIEEDNENPIYENIEIDILEIDSYLKDEINTLNNIYQSKYNDNYPPEPSSFSIAEEIIFISRVITSSKILIELLKNQYNVIFDTIYWQQKLTQLIKELENS